MSSSFSASAPGKLILLGEHAVLHGQPAIVCAVEDKKIHITLTPRKDAIIQIDSQLGHYQTTLENLKIEKPFTFILAALKHYQAHLPSGMNITVKSDFSDQMGLGSSAAVTVAMLKAMHQWLGIHVELAAFFQLAKQIVQIAQGGVGSGLDLAAAICGGTVYFDPSTQTILPLSDTPQLTIVYSGYKTPTTEVIRIVNERFKDHPETFEKLCQQMGDLSRQGKIAIENADWKTLGNLINQGQKIMDALGVNDATLQNIVDQLNQTPGILGAKISGSGLGDCVIGLRE